MIKRIGAENRRKEMNMVIKKKRVFTPLRIGLLLSSFKKLLISFFSRKSAVVEK